MGSLASKVKDDKNEYLHLCKLNGITPQYENGQLDPYTNDHLTWLQSYQLMTKEPEMTETKIGLPKLKVERLHAQATFDKAHKTDTGYDLTCIGIEKKKDGRYMLDLGIRVEIPTGYYMELVPRSSFSKTGFVVPHSYGVIDFSYRGTWYLPLRNIDYLGEIIGHFPEFDEVVKHFVGKKVAQAILRKRDDCVVEFARVSTDTDRGEGSFGSTGE